MSLTRTHMNLSKNQFYGGDGTGRDTYIYNNNGGFCPEKAAIKVEELGKSNRKAKRICNKIKSDLNFRFISYKYQLFICSFFRILRCHKIKTCRWSGPYPL